jgi:hypothetical protein
MKVLSSALHRVADVVPTLIGRRDYPGGLLASRRDPGDTGWPSARRLAIQHRDCYFVPA